MPNYASNTLRIHCDDYRTMEKIRELLFIRNEDGKIEYTMTKLIPIPEVSKSQTNNSLLARYRGISYWGTKWDFCWPELKTYRNEIILDYHTAWGPNDLWVHELCCQVVEIIDKIPDDARPKIFIKHVFDICEVERAGYMYWEPGMVLKYDHCSFEEFGKKYAGELMIIGEEDRRNMEVFEFHLEDHLEEEPYEDDFEFRFQRYG